MWMEIYRNAKSCIRAKHPHVFPMEGVAMRSCIVGHQHPPGIEQKSPDTLALPRFYRGAHDLHLLPSRATPRTRLTFLSVRRLGLFHYEEYLLPGLLQGTNQCPLGDSRKRFSPLQVALCN